MADDAYEERFQQHEDILRSLTAMLVAQREMNQRVEGFMQRQDALNERLTTAIERLDMTQDRIETLLARMIRTETNGRDA
jgi:uncharacterized protein (DUF342 family)